MTQPTPQSTADQLHEWCGRDAEFLSHAPGSLGVFELTLLVGLSQLEKEDLLGSLLIFRTLYFIAPFAAALVVLGIRELWLGMRTATNLQRCNRAPLA